MAAVLARVWRRFFKYLCWYFCNSAIVPLSACIFGETASPLVCCWWIVAIDDSESLEALDESDSPIGCCCCVPLTSETLILGDWVSDTAVVDSSLLFDDKILTLQGLLLLLLLLPLLMSAFKFIRLSFCTLFREVEERKGTKWPLSSSSSSSIRGNVNIWLCETLDEDALDGEDDCGCCDCELDKLPLDWFALVLLVEVVHEDDACVVVGRELKALVSTQKDESGLVLAVRKISPSRGVVCVGGDDVDEVVTDTVVMPIKLVVTMVSISGEESAVRVSKVGVWIGAVGVLESPSVEEFFLLSILLSSAGALVPPRQGKQHRNSVERNGVPRFHDCSSCFEILPRGRPYLSSVRDVVIELVTENGTKRNADWLMARKIRRETKGKLSNCAAQA